MTYKYINFFYTTYKHNFFFKWHINTTIRLSDIHIFYKWQYVSFNIEETYIHIPFFIYMSHNFWAHVHVMYYKQPTTSYHTVLGFPILARVTVHNFSKFDFIHVTFCVCLFRMDLLVQNDHLRDPLPDWNSQGYTVSLYFLSGWRWAFVPTQDTCKARHFR